MKTSQLKSLRILASLAIMLFIGSSLFANAKVYARASYQGNAIECGPGEHASSKFSKHFSRTTYCSVKLPKGYVLDVDYSGRGWRRGYYKTYTRSVSRLKSGFKKIRVRKVNINNPGQVERPNSDKPVCSNDWGIQFFQHYNYGGKYACFSPGYHKYQTNFRTLPSSFKVKTGYEVILYKHRRIVKKVSGSVKDSRYDFDQFKVQKKEGQNAECGRDWTVQFFQSNNYSGQSVCYPKGKHSYRPSFKGYPQSVKVKKGYKVLIMYRGQRIKEIKTSLSNVKLPRFDYIVMSSIDNGDDSTKPVPVCGNDWVVQCFQNNNYQGKSVCYPKGKHRYSPSFRGTPQSIKVKKGYKVLFMSRGRKVKEISGSASNVRLPYFDYIVMSSINNGDTPTKPVPGCGSDWVVQCFQSNNYRGQSVCFPKGEHNYRASFRGTPKSIKVKKGYKVLFMSRGRKVKEISGSASYVRIPQFDYIVMSAINSGDVSTKPVNDNSSANSNSGRSGSKNSSKSLCNTGWKVKFYRSESFRGEPLCYGGGQHNYPGFSRAEPRSIKVTHGYELILYRDSRVVKILTGGISRVNLKFNKFRVQAITPQTANGINCGSNWAVQFSRNQNFSGPSSCFTQGKHSYTPSSLGYPKSIQVKRGYYIVFKYRGKIILSSPRSIPRFNKRFDEIEVKVDNRYQDGPRVRI